MTPRAVPWWSRLYLAVPRRAIVGFAHLYVRVKAFLAGPWRARRWARRLGPYANLVGWPVDVLQRRRMVELTVEQLDDVLVNRPAFPLTPPHRIRGAEHLTAAAAAGRGVIVGFEHTIHRKVILAVIYSLVGPQIRVLRPPSRPEPPAKSTRQRLRRRFSARVDRSDNRLSTRNVREALRLLAAGHVVIIAADGRGGKQLPVPLLGTTVHRPTGPARLSYRTGAPIVMAVPKLDSGGRIAVTFCPPISARRDLSEDAAVSDAMLRIAEVVEPHLRKRPWVAAVKFVHTVARASSTPAPSANRP